MSTIFDRGWRCCIYFGHIFGCNKVMASLTNDRPRNGAGMEGSLHQDFEARDTGITRRFIFGSMGMHARNSFVRHPLE